MGRLATPPSPASSCCCGSRSWPTWKLTMFLKCPIVLARYHHFAEMVPVFLWFSFPSLSIVGQSQLQPLLGYYNGHHMNKSDSYALCI
ncbi:hypothetical protein BDV12DRAFT_34292 [Aspergillus spectabilis]